MALPGSGTTSLPSVQLDQFEGPLDHLLDEVRRQNVEIEKIAMAPIVARFLEYVQTAPGRNLNLDIEWLHMAATLIHWKSRSLLPSDPSGPPEADPIRDDLVQQLLAHRRQAAQELARRRCVEETRFSRDVDGTHRGRAQIDEPAESPFVSVWDMIQQARELSHWVEEHRQGRRQWHEAFCVEQDDGSVAEMIEYLRTHLATEDERIDGDRLLQGQPTASRRACLFLGMLEMVRHEEMQIEQNESFGAIWLTLQTRPR